MAIANSLRKIVDRKEWEQMTSAPVATSAGAFTITDPSGEDKAVMFVQGASAIYRYDHHQDGWQQLPNSGIAGTFGAGSCGAYHIFGPGGTATGGSTTTINTNLTLNRSLKGYYVRVISGPGAGEEKQILSNTISANSIITVASPFSVSITSSSVYLLLTGRYWFFNAGSGAVGFSYYDRALNTWTSRSVTNLPTTFGTEGRLVATGLGIVFASGQATSGTSTTITNSAKNWTPDQWKNYQIRITAGTAAGLTGYILSNTSTQITLTAALSITPDNTSQYVIESAADSMYLLGNNAVTMYKYSISGNSWSTLSPGVARGGNMAAGGGANWVYNVSDSAWTNESAILNGRYIYSWRGGGSAVLDRYDIAANTWSALTYAPQVDTFNTGSCYDYDDDYIMISKEATGRLFRYMIAENRLIPWSTLIYPNGAAVVGDKMWTKTYIDGNEKLKWVYHLLNTSSMLFRCLMIDKS